MLMHGIMASIETGYQGISISTDEAAQIQGVLGQVFEALSESTSDEKKLLAGQKAKLEAEQVKLLQAHHADATQRKNLDPRSRGAKFEHSTLGGPSGRLVETCPTADSDGASAPVDPR